MLRWFLDVVPHVCMFTVVSYVDITLMKYIMVSMVESIAKANSPISTSETSGTIELSDEVTLAGTGPSKQCTLVKRQQNFLLGLK